MKDATDKSGWIISKAMAWAIEKIIHPEYARKNQYNAVHQSEAGE